MNPYTLAHGEAKFADLVWEHAPLPSMELVKLAQAQMHWKKSTTYTVLKKLCTRGIFKNEDAIVSAVFTREEFYARQSRRYIQDTFDGSLPKFITAFTGGRGLSDAQAQELMDLIQRHAEENDE